MIRNGAFPIDILDDGENYYIIMDCPSVIPESFEIYGDEKQIIIKGVKAGLKIEGKYILIERYKGKFLRKLSLPQPINIEKAKAEYKEGVLIIKAPKIKDEILIDSRIKIKISYRR
ncbi:Hsp20/alpha crystallin family protein [Hydrogenothermus marinus]|uniref:HSP20 family protein n=1 Tax=Hydrogenothermus marinus TaxID=133270 RepID=A0A3M0BF30_9AQUI|nr:Hsp20/alpha crystallin family protein [Hydrogenothermus marinus]RMA96023.1 HSP20 family protein [Hydrogenothermus marinus]